MVGIKQTLARLLLLVLGLLARPTVSHAGPREELLRLAPPDSNFVVVVQQLRDHWQAVANSKWLARFTESHLGKSMLNAPELAQLSKVRDQLIRGLRVTPAQLRDEIFGDAVVLAFRAGPPDQPQMDEGLLLSWTRDPDLASTVLDRLNQAQRLSGELKQLAKVEYRQRTYTRRTRQDGGEEFFYQQGSVVVISPTETALRQLIDRDLQSPGIVQQTPPLETHLRKLGVAARAALVWFNPRRFDLELKQTVAKAQGAERAFLQQFARYWQACDGLAVSLDLSQQLDLALSLSVRTADLPASTRRFLTTANTPSGLWSSVPSDALLAVCGRCDLVALTDMIGEFLTPADRKQAQQTLRQFFGSVLDDEQQDALLAGLGPDFGLWLAPPADKGIGLPRGLLAVRLRPTPAGESLESPLMETFNYFATIGVAAYNASHPDQIRLRSLKQGPISLRTIVGDKGFFALYQPTFACKEGYMLLGTSAREIAAFAAPPARPTQPAPPAEQTVPWVRVSLKNLANYIRDNRAFFAGLLLSQDELVAEGLQRLDRIIDTLELFDTVELLHRSGSDRADLIVRVRPALPLR